MASEKGELEKLKGVGPSRAEKLRKNLDIEEIKELVQLSKEELKQVPGVGEKRAENILESAKDFIERCDRCDSVTYPEEVCESCSQELKEGAEDLKARFEEKAIPEGLEEDFRESLEEIVSKREEGELDFEALDSLEQDVEEAPEKTEGPDITSIKGVGGSRAERLKDELEIDEVKDLVQFDKDDLTDVKGIGEKRAEEILTNVNELLEKCGRCGTILHPEERCETCVEELEKDTEHLRRRIDEAEIPVTIKETFEGSLAKIDLSRKEGALDEGFEALDSLRGDLRAAEEVSEQLDTIKTEIDENSDIVDFSIYNRKVEEIKEYFEDGEHEKAKQRAEKLLRYIEDEREFAQMDKEELGQESVVDFSRKTCGIKSIIGEKIYKAGYHTLKDVVKTGPTHLKEEADIDKEMANLVIKRIDDFAGEEEFEVEEEVEEEIEEEIEPLKEEESTKKEEVFKEIEETKPPKPSKKKKKKKKPRPKKSKEVPERPKKEKPKRKPVQVESLEPKEEEEVPEEVREKEDKKYWIPAILFPIIFAVIALILFVVY